jgi:PAS domain S-box-containing protein
VDAETGLFLEPNGNAEKLYGLAREELVKVGPADMSPAVQPDGRPSLESAIEKITEALHGGAPVFDWMHRNAQGQLIPCEVRLVQLPAAGRKLVRASVTDITERKRAEEQLRQQAAYLNALNETALGLIGRLDVNSLLEDVINRAAELLDAPDGYLYLLEPDGQTMRMRVGTGTQKALIGARIHPGDGVTGRVWLTGAPLIVNDYRNWAGRMAGSAYDERRAVIGVPLTQTTTANHGEIETQVIGVIGLSHTVAGKQFDENAVTALTRFAQLASVALDNARLFEQAQQRATELAAVNEIARAISQQTDATQLLETLHENLKRVMSADVFYVGVYDRQTKLTTTPYFVDSGQRFAYPPSPLPPEHWLRNQIALEQAVLTNYTADEVARRHAAKTGETLLSGDVSKTFASSITVPFHVGEQFDAVISVLSYTLNAYTQQDLELVSGLSSHVAVALTNARLFAQTQSTLAQIQRQAQRDQVIGAITDRLHKATDVQTVMRIAAEELRKATGSKRAVVRVQRPSSSPSGDITTLREQPNGREDGKES